MPNDKEMLGLLESCLTFEGWTMGLKAILQDNADYLAELILNSEDPKLDQKVEVTERDRLRIKRQEILALIHSPQVFIDKIKGQTREEKPEDTPGII